MLYSALKKVVKVLLPESLLFRYEFVFRRLYALPYKGTQFHCNLCNSKLRKFIQLDRGDLLCPVCGSLPRHRRLWNLLEEGKGLTGNVLHFSPSRAMWQNLKKKEAIQYITTDYEPSLLADNQFDITSIALDKQCVDYIICYHVLEHIPEDVKAMEELYRVLKPDGQVYIQTPFKEGDIYENFDIVTPEDRLAHFGQEDHVRIYSVVGLKDRLEQVGFNVEVKQFEESLSNRLGFKSQETVMVCTK